MQLLKTIRAQTHSEVLPLSVLSMILDSKSEDARKGLLKRACQKGELQRIKNGLYVLGEEERQFPLPSMTIANHLVIPSYISLESALSYYGLIPEAVYTTTSVTTKKNLEHPSEVGHFSFTHLKQSYFNFGYFQMKETRTPFLIATPLKALMDYIVVNKKSYGSIADIEDDLRFDWEEFLGFPEFVNRSSIELMMTRYKGRRERTILKSMKGRL